MNNPYLRFLPDKQEEETNPYLRFVPQATEGGPPSSPRSAASNITRGLMQGLGEAGTSTIGAIGTLTGSERLKGFAERSEEEMRAFYDAPESDRLLTPRNIGRGLGEVALGVVGGSAGVKAATRLSPRLAQALAGASRVQRGLATAAANAPIDIVQGAKSDDGIFLPGRLGSIVENVGLTGVAGALLPAARAARQAEVPPVRQLPAGQYEMGPLTTRLEPETNPARLLPSQVERPVSVGPVQGPAIPTRGQLEADDIARRLAEAASRAPAPAGGIEIVRGGGRTRQQQAAYLRSIQETEDEIARDLTRRRALPSEDTAVSRALEAAVETGRRMRGPEGLIARPGVIAPELLSQGGGAVLGAGAGLASSPEGEDAFGVAGRVLGGAAAGAGAGRLALRAATRGGRRPSLDPDTPEGRVMGTINTGERGIKTPLREQAQAFKDRLYTDYISETDPLVRAARAAGGEAGERRMQGAIAQLHGHQRAAQQYLDDMVGAPLRAARDREDAVRALLKARRDLDIRTRGGAAKSAADIQDLQAAVQRLSQDPAVMQAADAINAMHRDLLDKRYAAGLLTDDAYQAIRQSEDFYTPFVREYADAVAASGAGGGRLNVRTSGVKRMDRTTESIANTADPLEVAMTAAERTYRDVAKQRIQNFVVEMAEAGQLPPVRRVTGTPSRDARTFEQIVDGKRVQYEVTDPDLYDVIAGVDNDTAGTIQRLMRAYTSIGRTAITMLPDFAIANVVRDIGQAAPQTLDVARSLRETGAGAAAGAVLGGAAVDEDESALVGMLQGAGFGAGVGGFASPVARTLKAVSEVATNAENYKAFLRTGGSTEGFNVRTPKDARAALEALQRSGVELSDVINPKRWVDALQWIGSVGEQATRLAKYEEAIAAGRSVPEAAYLAQDVSLRFRNIGRSTKGIASITKFWNAKVQGWDKLQRMVRDPKTAGLATAMVTAPTVALWSVNKDNPEYWERPQWERNMFWLVPKGGDTGGFWRIPKPFEFGYLFASLPERMLDFAAQRGDIASAAGVVAEPTRELGRATRNMALSTMEGAFPVPDLLSTGLQLAQGRDWFRNQPIVTRPSLPAPMQVNEQTSAIARQAGRLGASPEMVDFALNEALGSSGRVASRAVDAVARRVGADAPDPVAQGPTTFGVPQRFQTKQYAMTDREAGARDRLRALDRVWAGYDNAVKSDDPAAIERYIRDNRRELEARAALDGARTALEQATTRRRQIIRNPVLTPDQRRELLDGVRAQADEAAEFIQSFKIPTRQR